MFVHLVARALPGFNPFADPETAWWCLSHLRYALPLTLAVCLMPNHLHLITSARDKNEPRNRLARVLSGVTRRAGVKHLFERVPDAEPVVNGLHLDRQARYVHLNPCRVKLVADPLSWPWSTHRGLVGAELDPWVPIERLAQAMGRPPSGMRERLHTYVSGDPAVGVAGSSSPTRCPARDYPTIPLETIRLAALSATPWSRPAERRKLVLDLAVHQGWTDPKVLAISVGMVPRSVRRSLARARDADDAGTHAARLCLGDRRLLLPEKLVRPLRELPRSR